MRDDAWFAGFADGEGCFQIRYQRDRDYYHPMFALALRADDVAVLEELRGAFGGVLNLRRAYGATQAAWMWRVHDKRALRGLIEYFDRFPLRAKKARDYAIWRQAVKLYCAHGARHPGLPTLYAALTAGRAYDADLPDPVEPFAVQTALDID